MWWGVPLVCALTACGASGCYLLSWAFGRRLVETYLSHRISPLRQRVRQSLVYSLSLVGHGVVPALLWGGAGPALGWCWSCSGVVLVLLWCGAGPALGWCRPCSGVVCWSCSGVVPALLWGGVLALLWGGAGYTLHTLSTPSLPTSDGGVSIHTQSICSTAHVKCETRHPPSRSNP